MILQNRFVKFSKLFNYFSGIILISWWT